MVGGPGSWGFHKLLGLVGKDIVDMVVLAEIVKTATEVGVRAIQDHKVIEWNTCWKCKLSEGTDDM